MMNGFQPIMQPDQVATIARYYNDVFVPLGTVTPTMSTQNLAKFQAYLKGFGGMRTDAAKLVPLLAQALQMTPAQVQAMMATQLPSMAAMAAEPARHATRLRRVARDDAERRHLQPGPCGARALRAARDDDAGERGQLQAGQQPARLPAVHRLLRRPRCLADPARRLRPVWELAPGSDRLPPSRPPDARMIRPTPQVTAWPTRPHPSQGDRG